ncbi:MAG: SPOR domain-containing protein [Alteromonadaceae bacterium]|nr:SPOR domain-containing protein [Alteromonadaceae bacterium]
MAHQDYVSRSSNKKNSPYKAKQSSGSPGDEAGIPLKVKLIGLFTLVAIVVFGYFLWSIKDNQPADNTTKKNTSVKKMASAELPEPPKEKWTYVDGLKSKQVEVGEYEVKQAGPYAMQCGSFRSQKQAEVLKANVAFNGIGSKIHKVTGKSGIWYKVVLGPYARKRLAEKDKHKLKSNNIHYCQILLWK